MSKMISLLSAIALLAALVASASAAPKSKKPVYPTPEEAKADPDFAVQGEYVGQNVVDGNEVKYAGQIIALGGGKFHGVGYVGGLPGDGWDGKTRMEADGQTADGAIVFKISDRTATLKDGVITVKDADGKVVGTLKKVERQSPTMGAKPPEGAVVLFDGTSVEKFDNAQLTKDGIMMVTGPGAFSKPKFQSCTIHVEFRTPFKPNARGQDRGNSGLYMQGRYEAQILDSFGLVPKDNECGGIYSIKAPGLNMCLPPLAWQTYDGEFTAAEYKDGKKVKNARLTLRLNGVEIQKDVELTHGTTAAPIREAAQPGPVYLQNHGNPVQFRNVWVVEKK